MSTSVRREYRTIGPCPDGAEALWEADLARITLRREFEGWGRGRQSFLVSESAGA
jgi:hypothetical protein